MMSKQNRIWWTTLLAVVMLAVFMTGCGQQSYTAATTNATTSAGAYGGASPAETKAGVRSNEMADKADSITGTGDGMNGSPSDKPSSGTQTPNLPAGRKIIREGSANIETIAYDEALATLYQMITDMGGYVESQNLQGGSLYREQAKFSTIAFRIPSDRFDEAFQGLSKVGTVTNNQSYGSDITDQYADTEVRINSLLVQEKRILELVAKAEKIEDIVALEARLSDIRYQIESMQNSLNNFDRLLAYSRITVNINEVRKVTETKPLPKTLGERMQQAFEDAWDGFVTGLQDFVVWFASNIFRLVIWLIVILGLLMLARKVFRKRKKAENQVAEKTKD